MNEKCNPPYPIIIVDDEEDILETESVLLTINGYSNVLTCSDSRKAYNLVDQYPQCIIVLDITMPHVSGIDILTYINRNHPDVTVVMLTGHNDVETAVQCIKKGAFDYIVKPVDQSRFITSVKKAIEHRTIKQEAERLGQHLLNGDLKNPTLFKEIITKDKKLDNIFKYIEAVAPAPLPILITGETGTGKELFAKALHDASGVAGQFVCVNTAGIDDTLFSDTIFGHEPGAFTGAQKCRKGLIEKAEGGTLFLDEIGDMRTESQVKLLRLLQEGTYYPLGAEVEKRSSARVVAATNRPIEELQADTNFRKDLFYRLKSHHIAIPPLRERNDDIPLLAEHFLYRAALQQNKKKPTAPRELYTILSNYSFPGNIRELQGMVFDAVSRHSSGTLSCDSFKEVIYSSKPKDITKLPLQQKDDPIQFPSPLPTAREIELELISEALKRSGGNKKLASEMIGMARQTFRNKVKELDKE